MERLLADFDDACGMNGVRLNSIKTLLVNNGFVSYSPFKPNEINISERFRKKWAVWGPFKEHQGYSDEDK